MWMSDKNLISKENGRIFVGSEEFNSATSALGAYIDIFKTGNHININSKLVGAHKRKVGDFLLPKSCPQVTTKQSLDDGTCDTPYEIHLFNQKKKIEKQHEILLSSSVNTDVISQADQTVKETAAFLDNFQTRRMSPAPLCCVSDIGSMTTEYLLSASPYPPEANPIERDQNGVCKRCGGSSEWNLKNDKQTIPKTCSNILKKSSLPLPINSNLSLNSYFACMRKSSKNIQNCFVNNDVHTGIKTVAGKVKKMTKDKKKVCIDSTDKEVCSSHVELRKAERLTCPKADWQNIDSRGLKNTKILTSTYDNCKNAKIKPSRKISYNISPNKDAKNPLLMPSKTDFLQTPNPYSKIQQNIAKTIPKSECKANLSKNILYKSTSSSQTGKELAKCTQSKHDKKSATTKNLKSVQKKNPNPSKNLVSRNQKNDSSSLEILKKHNCENSSVNQKISKTIKRATKSGIISKEILCSPKKPDICNTLESAHFHSLSISSIPNQSQTLNESILPDNQKDHKKSITNCELLSNYPQVPDWVKQLESSMASTRIETPTLPIDEVSCQIPAQKVSPPNLTQSWSLSGIPLISPQINHNKTTHSLLKNLDSNCSLREYQELFQFKDIRNVDTCDQAQFHSQSIQSLLDRYLNDQTKELSKLKSQDTFTNKSLNDSNSQSGQPVNNYASHRSSCLNCLSTPPLSPVSCEAILDYPCFDKSEEMLKFPFLSSTPNKGHQCHCNSDSMIQKKSDPICDEFELQDAGKHRCMETLKNMLFRLQVEEESMRLSEENKSFSLCQSEDPKKNSSFPGISPPQNAIDNHEILSLSADNAGFASIDKAFDHLNRLKAVLNGNELPNL